MSGQRRRGDPGVSASCLIPCFLPVVFSTSATKSPIETSGRWLPMLSVAPSLRRLGTQVNQLDRIGDVAEGSLMVRGKDRYFSSLGCIIALLEQLRNCV